MNTILTIYAAYVLISVIMTVWVARTLHKNGRMFPPNFAPDKMELITSGMIESIQIAVLDPEHRQALAHFLFIHANVPGFIALPRLMSRLLLSLLPRKYGSSPHPGPIPPKCSE